MTLIELSDDQVTVLTARARAEGLSLQDWFEKLALEKPCASTPVDLVRMPTAVPRRHISEVIRNRMRNVSAEVWAQVPTDGASEHDHYIYRLPKKHS